MLPSWLTPLTVDFAPVSPALPAPTASGALWQAAPGRFLLEVPGVGRYLSEDGQRLVIDAAPTASESQLARFARTTPLAALLYQRGMLAFHAAAISSLAPPARAGVRGAHFATKQSPVDVMSLRGRQPEAISRLTEDAQVTGDCFAAETPSAARNDIVEGALLLAGDSGSGKSTLLAHLLQHGWTMLSDDLAAVGLGENQQPAAYPLHPEILLWGDSLKKLGLEPAPEAESLENGKRAFPASPFAAAPAPLRGLAWLSPHNQPPAQNAPLRGQKYVSALNALLYNSHIADALLDRRAHFRLTSLLAQTVPLQRIHRLRGEWNFAELESKVSQLWPEGAPRQTE